ncbi:hypothetical protein EVAR_98331_1 [Eumeta japonica]|uniref:Uncharacterized protein n=1 Tax=Eumeta variegata TaxID=151549 RepID=A0A4C1XDD6_EUMVA|nr:hypothetical protein EVAR_98331_1 [Eumeta japonica]
MPFKYYSKRCRVSGRLRPRPRTKAVSGGAPQWRSRLHFLLPHCQLLAHLIRQNRLSDAFLFKPENTIRTETIVPVAARGGAGGRGPCGGHGALGNRLSLLLDGYAPREIYYIEWFDIN